MPPDAGKPSGGNEAYLRDMVDACERVATVHVPALLGGLRPLLPPDDAL